jgi:hypothetical protein
MVAEEAAVIGEPTEGGGCPGNNDYGNLEHWRPHGCQSRDSCRYDDDREQCPEAMAWRGA